MTLEDPPRIFGALLALLGAALTFAGISLLRHGDGAYFLVAGLGVLASGLLIARGKLVGAWVFAATLALMAVWSVADVGAQVSELLPRLALPAIICAYIFSGRIRPRLS